MAKKAKKVRYICSDIYQQVRPESADSIKHRLETCGENSLYPFRNDYCSKYQRGISDMHKGSNPDEVMIAILEGYNLNYTNRQVLNLLQKAIQITANSEEGVKFTLEKLFMPDYNRKFAFPPGTLRFYSQHHICFWSGKNWRKIVP
jgi:hypothetical protein